MKKNLRLQFSLILIVGILTCYNILPTILFYTKPLSKSVDQKIAMVVAEGAAKRVNRLEKEAVEWLKSFHKLLKITPTSIKVEKEHPEFIHVDFDSLEAANKLRTYLPRAGALIPFVPAQLSLLQSEKGSHSNRVTIQRKIPLHFDTKNLGGIFKYTPKREKNGDIAPLYSEVIQDRLLELGRALGGVSENAQTLENVLQGLGSPRSDEFLEIISRHIHAYTKAFGENSPISKRFFATFTQGHFANKSEAVSHLIAALERYRDQIKLSRIALEGEESKARGTGGFLEANDQQKLDFLKTKEERIISSISILKKQAQVFASGEMPWKESEIKAALAEQPEMQGASFLLSTLGKNPLIESVLIDWKNETLKLELYQDLIAYKDSLSRKGSTVSDALDQLIYNEIARIGRESGEELKPTRNGYEIALCDLANSESLLVMDLKAIAKEESQKLTDYIKSEWAPRHPDLIRDSFPIYDYETFKSLPPEEQKIGLVIYSPASSEREPQSGFRNNSLYVIAKGIQEILAKLNLEPNSPKSQQFLQDFNALRSLLSQNGFSGYPGTIYPLSASFAKDYIFEADEFYHTLLKATREEFKVHGTHTMATLEFSNYKQRILTLNQIETREHEDLLKWRDEYQAAQVRPELHAKLDIPAPTQSPLWSNLALSMRKYFRGDERKILKWGLDLSGGKTVEIQLRDRQNKAVTNDADIRQGIDELYGRVNKMGVSEVSIRQEGSNITLDFPSAQGLSAADLVKAS